MDTKSANQYLYSCAAAGRIFSRPASHVLRLEVWDRVVLVWIKGDRPRFVSKSVFRDQFVLSRRLAGKQIRESAALNRESQNTWSVRSDRTGELYLVVLDKAESSCDCKDYRLQVSFFGKGCCKHIYAALQMVGYSKLSDFVANPKKIAA